MCTAIIDPLHSLLYRFALNPSGDLTAMRVRMILCDSASTVKFFWQFLRTLHSSNKLTAASPLSSSTIALSSIPVCPSTHMNRT